MTNTPPAQQIKKWNKWIQFTEREKACFVCMFFQEMIKHISTYSGFCFYVNMILHVLTALGMGGSSFTHGILTAKSNVSAQNTLKVEA